MAARMGVSKHVLQNKVNPNCTTHHTTDEELEEIQTFADTDEIAKEFAAQRRLICIPMPSYEGVSDSALLDLFLALEKEKGDWSQALQEALADGGIDPLEFEHIDEQFREYCAAGAEVMSRLKSMVCDRRPAARGRDA
jgi:hypothetical protein